MCLPHMQLFILFLTFFAFSAVLRPTARAATVFTVTATADTAASDGICTLREAVLAANGSPANADCGSDHGAPYTVNFNVNGTIALGSGFSNIERNMTIDGAGHSVTVSGNNTVPVFTVMMGVTFNLQNLTVANGNGAFGGGILNNGMLNVSNCTFTGNSATSTGGAISNNGTVAVTNSTISGNNAGHGGGIFNSGTLTVMNSTISGNSASHGGGIVNSGTSTVKSSTISGNSATGSGGAISNNGTVTVTNCTMALNSASFGGGILNSGTLMVMNNTISGNSASFGGGIDCPTGTTTITNSIIANSGMGGNCIGACTGSYNLVDDNTCGAGFTNSLSINLGQQGNYGGGTLTIPLLPGSSAIDAGDSATCADVATVNGIDQRGFPRPAGHCDIGAFESRGFTLAKTGGDNQGASVSSAFASPLQVSLNEAGGAGLPGALVTFTAPSSGPSTNPAIFTATTGANSIASAMAFANGTVGGPYSVTASVPGATSVNFSLTNLPLATLTIAFAGNGSGMVSSTSPADPGISCSKGSPGGCSAGYPLNTAITLSATGDWKSIFGGWSGGAMSSASPVTFTLDSDKTVTATFNPDCRVVLFPGGALFAAIQDAYASVQTGSMTIKAQAHAFLEEILFDKSTTNVVLEGGMDGSFNPTSGYSTVEKLTVGRGQAKISNIVIK